MSTTIRFLRRDPAEVRPWAETCGQIRCLVEEKDAAAAEVHHVEIHDAKLHYHERTDEFYYVISGQGTMLLDDEEIELHEGVVVYVPRGVRHKAIGKLTVLTVCMLTSLVHGAENSDVPTQLGGGMVLRHDRADGPVRGDPPTEPEPKEKDKPAAERLTLPSDATARMGLDEAEDLVKKASWQEAAEILHNLLNRKVDSFVDAKSTDPDGRTVRKWVSVRAEAVRLLDSLPPAGRVAYAKQFGAKAEMELADAKRGKTTEPLADVVRRYPHTEAGAEAADLLATQYAKDDQPELALRYLEFLIARSGGKPTPTVLFRAALAARRAGNAESSKIEKALLAGIPKAGQRITDAEGKLAILDVSNGRESYSCQLEVKDVDKAQAITLLADRERFYVAVNRPPNAQANPWGGPWSSLVNVSRTRPVNGRVLGINRTTGKKWRLDVEDQVLVLDHFGDLPILLFTARSQQLKNGAVVQATSTLSVEKRTGKVLYDKTMPNNNTNFHTFRIDVGARTIDLIGYNLKIRLSVE